MLTQKTLEWLAAKHPTVDITETMERFVFKAEKGGWMYHNWQRAFQDYVANGPKYGGVIYKGGREHDPRWQSVLHEARKAGYPREPDATETPGLYRTALEQWKLAPKSNVVDFSKLVKRVAK